MVQFIPETPNHRLLNPVEANPLDLLAGATFAAAAASHHMMTVAKAVHRHS